VREKGKHTILSQHRSPALSHPPTLWCDNLGALSLASNPVYHARIKHIEVDYHFIREKVVNKDISTRYISTLDQIADLFTKGLTTSRFLFLCDKLHVCSSPVSLQEDVSTYEPSKASNCTDSAIPDSLQSISTNQAVTHMARHSYATTVT